VVCALAIGHASSGAHVSAQGRRRLPRRLAQIEALLREKELRTPSQRKLDSQLVYGLKMRRGESIASGVRTLASNLRHEPDDKLVLDVAGERGDRLVAELRAAGVEIVNAQRNYGTARIRASLDQLEAIAALPEVRFIQPKQEAITWGAQDAVTSVGSQNSEGDVTHRASNARGTFGVNGSGVKIGVLSNGVTSLASSQAFGDLGQ
jgi:hypothetical protein